MRIVQPLPLPNFISMETITCKAPSQSLQRSELPPPPPVPNSQTRAGKISENSQDQPTTNQKSRIELIILNFVLLYLIHNVTPFKIFNSHDNIYTII